MTKNQADVDATGAKLGLDPDDTYDGLVNVCQYIANGETDKVINSYVTQEFSVPAGTAPKVVDLARKDVCPA